MHTEPNLEVKLGGSDLYGTSHAANIVTHQGGDDEDSFEWADTDREGG